MNPDDQTATSDAKDPTCVQFNDIFEEVPSGTLAAGPHHAPGKRDDIRSRNLRNRRLYRAVRHVLEKNFQIRGIPAEPSAFATASLTNDRRAQFSAILGIIQADNWEDPSNGKDAMSDGDDALPGDDPEKKSVFVIDRRFIDAVVEAVKEYTEASKLFNAVFALMSEEVQDKGAPKPA